MRSPKNDLQAPLGGVYSPLILCRLGKTSRIKSIFRKLLGEVVYYKIISYKVCITNEFYPTYKQHQKKR